MHFTPKDPLAPRAIFGGRQSPAFGLGQLRIFLEPPRQGDKPSVLHTQGFENSLSTKIIEGLARDRLDQCAERDEIQISIDCRFAWIMNPSGAKDPIHDPRSPFGRSDHAFTRFAFALNQ